VTQLVTSPLRPASCDHLLPFPPTTYTCNQGSLSLRLGLHATTWVRVRAVATAGAVTITPHSHDNHTGPIFFLNGGLSSEAVGTVVALLELLRRAQWTFLRLENEYLNNSARYRSVVATPILLAGQRGMTRACVRASFTAMTLCSGALPCCSLDAFNSPLLYTLVLSTPLPYFSSTSMPLCCSTALLFSLRSPPHPSTLCRPTHTRRRHTLSDWITARV
jgi:hypothetical protein